jgi:hypothetical protein
MDLSLPLGWEERERLRQKFSHYTSLVLYALPVHQDFSSAAGETGRRNVKITTRASFSGCHDTDDED